MTTSTLPIRAQIPWYFRVAMERIASGGHGGYLILRWIKRLNLLNQCAPFPINGKETIMMPLDWPLVWRPNRFAAYEPDAISLFAAAIDHMVQPAVFVDCGADVGLFTRLVVLRTLNIARVIAFEPNPRSHYVLERNLRNLAYPHEAHQAGIGAENGFGALSSEGATNDPDYKDHASFVRPSSTGFPVRTIDSLGLPTGVALALKIDVEGAELDALNGAKKTLTEASDFVLQIEAHRDVMRRTGIDPIECVRAVGRIAPVDCVACEERTRSRYPNIDPGRPFFDQVGDHHVLDLIITRKRGSNGQI